MTAPNTLEEATLLASRCLWLNPPYWREELSPTPRQGGGYRPAYSAVG